MGRRGQGVAEYAVTIALIAIVGLIALAVFGSEVSVILSTTSGGV